MPEWIDLIPKPRSRFLRVKCTDCGNEQIIFDRATIMIKCNVCEEILAEPLGGKAKIFGEVVNVFE